MQVTMCVGLRSFFWLHSRHSGVTPDTWDRESVGYVVARR